MLLPGERTRNGGIAVCTPHLCRVACGGGDADDRRPVGNSGFPDSAPGGLVGACRQSELESLTVVTDTVRCQWLEVPKRHRRRPAEEMVHIPAEEDQKVPGDLAFADTDDIPGSKAEVPAPNAVVNVDQKIVSSSTDRPAQRPEFPEPAAGRKGDHPGKVRVMANKIGVFLLDKVVDLTVREAPAEGPYQQR